MKRAKKKKKERKKTSQEWRTNLACNLLCKICLNVMGPDQTGDLYISMRLFIL